MSGKLIVSCTPGPLSCGRQPLARAEEGEEERPYSFISSFDTRLTYYYWAYAAIYSIFTSPTHPPVEHHLPTLIVTPHGRPQHVLYTYLHTNLNSENYLLTPSDAGDLCVAKLFPPSNPRGGGGGSSTHSHASSSSNSNAVKCEASRNLRWSISNTGIQNPVYKLTLPNPEVPQQDQPLFQVSKPNPNATWWTLFYFTYAGHLIPPKRVEFGRIQKNSPESGGGTRVTITGKSDEEKAVWKTLGEGNEDMVEWIVLCAALQVLDDEIVSAAERAGLGLTAGPPKVGGKMRSLGAAGQAPMHNLHPTGNAATHSMSRGGMNQFGPGPGTGGAAGPPGRGPSPRMAPMGPPPPQMMPPPPRSMPPPPQQLRPQQPPPPQQLRPQQAPPLHHQQPPQPQQQQQQQHQQHFRPQQAPSPAHSQTSLPRRGASMPSQGGPPPQQYPQQHIPQRNGYQPHSQQTMPRPAPSTSMPHPNGNGYQSSGQPSSYSPASYSRPTQPIQQGSYRSRSPNPIDDSRPPPSPGPRPSASSNGQLSPYGNGGLKGYSSGTGGGGSDYRMASPTHSTGSSKRDYRYDSDPPSQLPYSSSGPPSPPPAPYPLSPASMPERLPSPAPPTQVLASRQPSTYRPGPPSSQVHQQSYSAGAFTSAASKLRQQTEAKKAQVRG